MNTPNTNPPLSQTQSPKSKNKVDNQATVRDCPPPHMPTSQVEEIQTTLMATECSDQTKNNNNNNYLKIYSQNAHGLRLGETKSNILYT